MMSVSFAEIERVVFDKVKSIAPVDPLDKVDFSMPFLDGNQSKITVEIRMANRHYDGDCLATLCPLMSNGRLRLQIQVFQLSHFVPYELDVHGFLLAIERSYLGSGWEYLEYVPCQPDGYNENWDGKTTGYSIRVRLEAILTALEATGAMTVYQAWLDKNADIVNAENEEREYQRMLRDNFRAKNENGDDVPVSFESELKRTTAGKVITMKDAWS